MNLSTLTIGEARRALDAKEYSALELTDSYLKAIHERDGEIHAYLEVWEKTGANDFNCSEYHGFSFVPLISDEGGNGDRG